MQVLKRASVAVAALAGTMFLTMPTAMAGSNGPLATTAGSTAQWFHSTDYFTICDTRADGDPVYVEFSYTGSGGEVRLNWGGGNGTCVNRPYDIGEGKTVHYHSCIDDTFNDTCSGYKDGVA